MHYAVHMSQNAYRLDERRTPLFSLGDHLRKALDVSGVSSKEMAELLGVSRNTISNMLHDKVPVRRQTLLLWSARTGVSLRWLETGSYAEADEDDLIDQAYMWRQQLAERHGLETYETPTADGRGGKLRTRRDSNSQPSDP